jgi:hypothetical protein
MKIVSTNAVLLVLCGAWLQTGCKPTVPPSAPVSGTAPTVAATLQPTAGIQDIMAYMIDPAADFLWASVSTTVTEAGTDEKQPRTDDEWNEVRKQAIILTEAANLIVMDGRRVAREGAQLEDHGTEGNLTAEESEREIAANRQAFVSFAHALRDVGQSMLAAADSRNTQRILDAGDAMDQVCEGCHLKFWYPGQKIPTFPDQAPEPK